MKTNKAVAALLLAACSGTKVIPLSLLQKDSVDSGTYGIDSGVNSNNDSGNDSGIDTEDSGTEWMNNPVSIVSASELVGYVYQSQEAAIYGVGYIADADLETEHGDSHTAALTVDASLESLVSTTIAAVSGTQVNYQINFNPVSWTAYPSGTITGTATLIVCDAAASCASQTIAVTGYAEVKTAAYTVDQDVKLIEENPSTNYDGSLLMIGTSTSGRERSLVSFTVSDIANVYVTDAAMTISALSGTCRSSSDNHNCEHDMTAEVYQPTAVWDSATATWNSAAEAYNAAIVGESATINLSYGGSGSYDISITSAVQQWVSGANTGLLIKNSSEVTSGDQQVDVAIGSIEDGSSAAMNVEYWK